ncbi:hypothetical protein BST95_06410 [Halioglobus japonicus]|uniref:Prepilin-type N-terminal cleavage/methylation domain-containing protein n=1 Tax=Halioglobus japonicus TaxID=930805 RepID=A0AAP8MDM3_9GAMM|nr:PilW family protein [Halioglobus japonicus]AQA17924.1 hypothetical protein BST95_06410 [Halioglobus japonicus]PLW85886.1 hypothetical protein C0029_14965 [Halioglobus japonicus]GHD18014.1 type IV minor pilin protein PilW [Halioglobus japonicus]
MKIRQRHYARTTHHGGFSLIEFMVAMVLGIIVIAGAVSVYLASTRSLTEVDQVAGISENGQFALQLISYSAKHVGFFGGVYHEDIVKDGSLNTSITNDCTGDAAAYNTGESLMAMTVGADNLAYGCITDARENTDVLVIKNVIPAPIAADPNDSTGNTFPSGEIDVKTTYLVANSEAGMLVDGADSMPSIGTGTSYALANAWPYNVEVYYIRDSAIPTLSRMVLTWDGSGMAMQRQDLVQGVEDMRFLFGFDTGVDGTADAVAADPNDVGSSGWDQATSMQAYILMRAENDDYDYTNEKTYTLGDRTVTPNDTFRRVLLHADITLRNPRIVLRGGAS